MTMLAAAAILVGLYGLHRLAVWAEERGYIYYLRGRGSSGSVGSAFLEVQALLEPGVRHVVNERKREIAEEKESGDPPSPTPA
jgi:hypothetical protein